MGRWDGDRSLLASIISLSKSVRPPLETNGGRSSITSHSTPPLHACWGGRTNERINYLEESTMHGAVKSITACFDSVRYWILWIYRWCAESTVRTWYDSITLLTTIPSHAYWGGRTTAVRSPRHRRQSACLECSDIRRKNSAGHRHARRHTSSYFVAQKAADNVWTHRVYFDA